MWRTPGASSARKNFAIDWSTGWRGLRRGLPDPVPSSPPPLLCAFRGKTRRSQLTLRLTHLGSWSMVWATLPTWVAEPRVDIPEWPVMARSSLDPSGGPVRHTSARQEEGPFQESHNYLCLSLLCDIPAACQAPRPLRVRSGLALGCPSCAGAPNLTPSSWSCSGQPQLFEPATPAGTDCVRGRPHWPEAGSADLGRDLGRRPGGRRSGIEPEKSIFDVTLEESPKWVVGSVSVTYHDYLILAPADEFESLFHGSPPLSQGGRLESDELWVWLDVLGLPLSY